MLPHLIRAQSAYKDTRIHSFHHTHTHRCTCARTQTHTHITNTHITSDGLVKRQISMQRRRDGFSVLTYESEDECLMERVAERRSSVLKRSHPQGHRRCGYPQLSEESEKESKDEATQRGMEELYQKQCGCRWELFCLESGCWLVAGSQWKS